MSYICLQHGNSAHSTTVQSSVVGSCNICDMSFTSQLEFLNHLSSLGHKTALVSVVFKYCARLSSDLVLFFFFQKLYLNQMAIYPWRQFKVGITSLCRLILSICNTHDKQQITTCELDTMANIFIFCSIGKRQKQYRYYTENICRSKRPISSTS